MIYIYKGQEPVFLKELREAAQNRGDSPTQAYNRLGGKNKKRLRQLLIEEQGYVCCYCGKRIYIGEPVCHIPTTIIEHHFPRNPVSKEDRNQGLDYYNLLLSCNGNGDLTSMKKSAIDFTCDKHKANQLITVNPTKKETLAGIYYNDSGAIHSKDQIIDHDLCKVLNLNCSSASLVYGRKKVLDALIEELYDYANSYGYDEMLLYMEELLEYYEQPKTKQIEYVGILIWYLRNYLKGE